LKIGQYLVKLWARVRCLVFFDSLIGKEDVRVMICYSFDPQGIVPEIQAKLESEEIKSLHAVDNMARKYQLVM